MGVILSLLPKQIVIPDGAHDLLGFSNATGGTSALYLQAKRNYDNKLAAYNILVQTTQKKLDALNELRSYYKPYENLVNNNNWSPVIDFVLRVEGYGDAYYAGSRNNTYKKWISSKQMRNATNACDRLTADNWSYIYNAGILTGEQNYLRCQEDIVRDWLQQLRGADSKLAGEYDSAVSAQNTAKKAVDDAKAELDRAVLLEQQASDQRIKEAMSDPAFIQAQAAAAAQKRTTYVVGGILALAIVVGGAALIFKK